MSWFSLIQAEKTVLDSQNFFKSAITGEFIGEYAVDKLLKKNQTYLRIRKIVADFFTHRFSHPLNALSEEVSEKLLERMILRESFPQLFPEIFNPIHQIALKIHDQKNSPTVSLAPISLLKDKEEQPLSNLHQLVSHFLAKDEGILKNWVQAIEEGKEALEVEVKKVLISHLKPIGAKAIQASFNAIINVGIENAFDSSWKKGISIVSVTLIYKLTMIIFDQTGELCKNSFFDRTFRILQNNLPSSSTILTALTAIHMVGMVKIFWKTKHLSLSNTDLNKEQVKALVVALTQNSINQALQETEFSQALNLAFTQEKIQMFIIIFINEMIDHYWNDLYRIRFLNLPLVT